MIFRTTQFMLASLLLYSANAATQPPQIRCGWYVNVTPGNAELIDRDGQWTISEQGGYEAKGDWPTFKRRDWVETNGPHGHGCACMRVTVDRSAMRIRQVFSASSKPLQVCRQDRSIQEPR